MDMLIAFLSLAFFLAFIIGLIKPSIVRMPSRKRSSLIYLGGCFVLAWIGSVLYPTERVEQVTKDSAPIVEQQKAPQTFEYAGKTLKEYLAEDKNTRHDIVKNYVEFKGMPTKTNDGMYACLSELSLTKDGELKLSDVLGWCYGDYEKSPTSLDKKINFDVFQSNFSGWDGSYRPLEKLIKANMNDDSSYKHVSTTYRLLLGNDPHAVVKTTFRGTNTYGGVVKQSVAARVDVRTGEIVSVIDN